MHPLVSVVIPTFNAASFIVETIDSVLKQTYQPIEIIIVDDGSTDNTLELVENKYKDGVIRIGQTNSGPSAARNRGINESSGKYIAFLDADDLWLPGKIASQVAVMEKHSDVGLLCGDMVDFSENGEESQSHFQKHGLGESYFGDSLFIIDAFRKIYNNNFISTPTVMVRRSDLNNTKLFPLEFRFSEDYLLWLDLARISGAAYQTNVYTRRRKHAKNLTNDTGINVQIRPKVLDQINRNHGDYLMQLGIDIKQRYAEAWFQIGYYRLYKLGQFNVASDFSKSLKYKLNWRSFFYACTSAVGLSRFAVWLKWFLGRRGCHDV
ncbi:MAG: glycosyltransferase [Gammaproteobacteria bacterium]|nr:glycosyltransferase [Gammaproteobacteria bacterium]